VTDALERALAAVDRMQPWRRGGEAAPHKPLLLLWAIRRLQLGRPRLVDFNDAEGELRDLIARFTPGRSRVHPEYPFWRLQADGLWNVEDAGSFPNCASNTDPPLSALREHHARGGLPGDLFDALRNDPSAAEAFALAVVRRFFDASDHAEVLVAVGFQRTTT
jgi:putative restriction endonuclease